MISSGATAVATTDDTPVIVKDFGANTMREVTIINEGSVAGFFCLNGNSSVAADWSRLPAGPSSITIRLADKVNLYVKRVPSGSNVTGVWAWALEK